MIIDEDDYLMHHGIKGQKWGVITKRFTSSNQSTKNNEPSGSSNSKLHEDFKKHPRKELTPEEKANVAKASKKFEAQREESSMDSPRWKPTKKQVATVAIGAAAAGAIIGGIIISKKLKAGKIAQGAFSVEDYKNALQGRPETPDWIAGYAGAHMSREDYKGITAYSRDRVWGGGNYLTAKSFDQKETIFEPGHEFFRVSHKVEDSFRKTTYMTPNKECLARYHLGWKDATTNIINFKSKEQIRVPDLHTRLEAVREELVKEGDPFSRDPNFIMRKYSIYCGGDWQGGFADKVIANLKAKGFDAIVDDMDAGVYGEMPLVLFSPEKMTEKITTLYKDVDVKALEEILTDIPNRR